MKDEELFNAWKSEQYKDQSTEEKMEFVEHLHTFPKYFEKTFLAGLKAGRPQWHDLRENPNDLPKNTPYFSGQSVRVIGAIPLSEDKYISLECRYFYSEKRWKTQEDCSVVKVIAWCEIPTFDKE